MHSARIVKAYLHPRIAALFPTAAGGICSPLSVVLLDELYQGVIHLFRMRSTQEVLPILDSDELRVWRVLEHLDFSFRVGDGIYSVVGSLHAVSILDRPSFVGDCLHGAT